MQKRRLANVMVIKQQGPHYERWVIDVENIGRTYGYHDGFVSFGIVDDRYICLNKGDFDFDCVAKQMMEDKQLDPSWKVGSAYWKIAMEWKWDNILRDAINKSIKMTCNNRQGQVSKKIKGKCGWMRHW